MFDLRSLTFLQSLCLSPQQSHPGHRPSPSYQLPLTGWGWRGHWPSCHLLLLTPFHARQGPWAQPQGTVLPLTGGYDATRHLAGSLGSFRTNSTETSRGLSPACSSALGFVRSLSRGQTASAFHSWTLISSPESSGEAVRRHCRAGLKAHGSGEQGWHWGWWGLSGSFCSFWEGSKRNSSGF